MTQQGIPVVHDGEDVKRFNMPTLTINLSLTEDELRLLFDRYFNQPEKIVLSSSGFQNLLDEIDRKPSEETLKRREKISSVQIEL